MAAASSAAAASNLPVEAPAEHSFAPTDEGVMRGWLATHTPPAGQRLWFVLSAETLAYYESPETCDAAEPLGMLVHVRPRRRLVERIDSPRRDRRPRSDEGHVDPLVARAEWRVGHHNICRERTHDAPALRNVRAHQVHLHR